MDLACDLAKADGYKSPAQICRVISEAWFGKNAYCLSCTGDKLVPTPNNTKAADFQCQACLQQYELKTFNRPSRKIVDGAFSALMSRIDSGCAPTLMLMERTRSWQIQNLIAIHHLFLTPDVVEKRSPLSPTARRAGWIGCNIRLDLIASDGRIKVVQDGVPVEPSLVRKNFRQYQRLCAVPGSQRGWTTLTLEVVRTLKAQNFTLGDVYANEVVFARRFPNNNNLRPKIRQQLQVLRDLGYVEFLGGGRYQLQI